jgi:hypothetical protein
MNSYAVPAARPAVFGMLAFSATGIMFIGNRLWNATKEHAKCAIA